MSPVKRSKLNHRQSIDDGFESQASEQNMKKERARKIEEKGSMSPDKKKRRAFLSNDSSKKNVGPI